MEANSRFLLFAIVLCMPFVFLAESIDSDSFENNDLEFSDIEANIIEDEDTSSLLRRFIVKPNYDFTSPYQAIPGTYQTLNNSYFLGNGGHYNPKSHYAQYLANGAYLFYSKNCLNHYGQVPRIGHLDIDNAFSYANFQLDQRFPEYSNLSHYKETTHKEVEGRLLELVSEYFAKFKCFSKYQLTATLPVLNINKQYQTKNRHGDVSCTAFYDEKFQCLPHFNSKYRTIDGSCNNKLHPYWGRSSICHIRFLPADYSDGIQAFRMAKNGQLLPNPRSVSNRVALLKDYKSFYTTLLLAYGQFINHDISNTENFKNKPNGQVDCCVKPDSNCVAIPITDPNDYILTKFKTRCFNFVRSSSCPLCKLGPRQQLNLQSSFLDGSQVYGKNDKESASLRAFKNGLMAFVPNIRGLPILPPSDDAQPCTPLKPGLKCFVAGDNRVNQHPLLLTMHTLFLRLHNYHASRLQRVNPRWNDEKLFQEARRIVIAQIQNIAYNEYLQVILGPLLTNYYSLNTLPNGYTHYEPFTDPTTWNEFSTAASRYGHSQIKDHYKTISFSLINASQILLKDNFFEPGFAWDALIDDIIRGMINDVSNTIDPYYSITARNFIMRPKNKKHGIDLVATNIMRGRDHGIPGYVHFLKACFNYEARTWKDLENFIPVDTLNRLRAVYSSIEDIDLYIAGVSERHFTDASIGPTFGCLVGVQFYHLKFGDRFYYEHGGQSGSFRPDQLNNIRAASSFAQVLCRTSNLKSIQPKTFYLPSRFNQIADCVAYPDINYQLWRE